MVFSSPVFLFLFLPLVLVGYLAIHPRLRNTLLLGASIAFYFWGETWFTLVMLASIAMNYAFALIVARGSPTTSRWILVLCAIANLGLLVAFKYANFLVDAVGPAWAWLGLQPPSLSPIHLPAGISFFTFQAFSYVIDVHRGDGRVQKNPADVALYVALFPQLIAGPIVRYKDVDAQIRERTTTLAGFTEGVRRFVIGLAKKLLVANTLALPADRIFALPADELGAGTAWLGIACYTLQIYFDFSGYSDMAIGLGKMFGFSFLENFNYPYVARSITEFWRRWHISLSTWFRDYLYIPLGGNRRGPVRTYFNLVIVFLLCGLWHGANWTFVIWGLYHGAFLVLERAGALRWIERAPRLLAHAYTCIAVMVGWVFFRADTLTHAVAYLRSMAGLSGSAELHPIALYAPANVIVVLLVGIGCALPVHAAVRRLRATLVSRVSWTGYPLELGAFVALFALFALSVLELSASTYNPFIYFRF